LLKEAFRRITRQYLLSKLDGHRHSKRAEIEFFQRLSPPRHSLIAFGTPSRYASFPVLLDLPICKTSELLHHAVDCKGSIVGLLDRGVFYNVRVFPLLHAYVTDQLASTFYEAVASTLHGLSLTGVFEVFILGDPEVAVLGGGARFDMDWSARRVFEDACCSPHGGDEWPADYERREIVGSRSQSSATDATAELDVPTPSDAQIAAALKDRYGALIELLRRGTIAAVGEPVRPNDPADISASTWADPDVWIDVEKGDVLQRTDRDSGGSSGLRRWRAVELRRPTEKAVVAPLSCIDPGTSPSTSSTQIHASSSGEIKLNPCTRCKKEMLVPLMQASPDRRTHVQEDLFKQAKSQFGNFSERRFLTVWREAAEETGAHAWIRGGRRRGAIR